LTMTTLRGTAMNDIIITQATIDGLRDERAELEAKIAECQAQLELIDRKLQVVDLFASNQEGTRSSSGHTKSPSPIVTFSPQEAIMSILREKKTRLVAGEIRAALDEAGYPSEKWGKNGVYFYSVLKRLADTHRIKKVDNRYETSDEEKRLISEAREKWAAIENQVKTSRHISFPPVPEAGESK
jgi:hypothetical protein